MTKITESAIETYAVTLLEHLGYSYVYGPTIAPDGDAPERVGFDDVVLMERLRRAVGRINPTIAPDQREDAIRQIARISAPELIANNESFHRLLTEGVKVSKTEDGRERGDLVWLIDFDNPENNEFVVANQFTVIENHVQKRPDIILFVNGLPLGVIELKNAGDEKATIRSAYKQIQTYKHTVPSLFTFNAVCVISDGLEAKAGSISAGLSRFMAWKTSDGLAEANPLTGQMETLIKGMLNKATFLDLIRHFNVFETNKAEDMDTGIISISTVKKLASYHQYYAVNRAVDSTLRASGYADPVISQLSQPTADDFHEAPEAFGLESTVDMPARDRKGGVVWHTQGSGKSLSMVFYAGKIVLAMDNPTILVITDRNDLDDQLFDTFASSKQLLRQEPVQAQSRDNLKDLLQVSSGGIVFTTIQKFQPDEGNVYETLSERENIIVLADEAHRTQYGFKAKTIDAKDGKGNIVGKKTVYGFAKYMRDALPHATYLGFTGTPIEGTDVNTQAVFGHYVDVYDIAQAVEDGATVPIYYESRLAKIRLTEEGQKLVEDLDAELAEEDLTDNQKSLAKWTQLEALIGSKDRVERIAKDIVAHFDARVEVNGGGKAMVVAMSRRIAAELYAEIIKLRPDWHDDDLKKGAIKVVMTAASADGPVIAKHHTSKSQRRALADRMRNESDPLKLVIVRDMWLTGFDAPSMHTLYIDKPMKGHNLMQAIARVNRVHGDKQGGLVVDYLGIAHDLKKALSFYSDGGGKGDPAHAQEEAVSAMLEKLEVVSQMFHGYAYKDYFAADTGRKLSIILEAEDHILGLENGKTRFVNEVTKLSGAFSIAVPHDQAMDAKDEVAFFQAVKARLVKFEGGATGRSDAELDFTIRQTIDQALVSDTVIDIFDAAGIKKPNISILSDQFLQDVKDMKHKNVALELLKRLLEGEVKARTKFNLVQGKSLMELLQESIKRYHNKVITAAEFMDELIRQAKAIKVMDKEPEELGLTQAEYAFYTAVANNESAKELMQKDQLRELAIVLFEKVRENASIDWTIKESVRAKLKVIIKRTLRKFGYPPDMQLLATETVLKQAEMIAGDLTRGV